MKKSLFNNLKKYAGIYLLVILLPFVFTACDSNSNDDDGFVNVDDNGYTDLDRGALTDVIGGMAVEDLNDDEISGLLFMREEEKLAHDVYVALYGMWSRQVFDNISSSEMTHTNAVLVLIDKYELTDPAASSAAGEFVNTDLQNLYDTFVEAGETSMLEAMRVGAAIEEVDIIDIQTQRDNYVDNADITLVYENLMKGSRNHLRAFVRNLTQLGETYTPQYLSVEDYNAIINSDIERGRQ